MDTRTIKGPKPGNGRCKRCGGYFSEWTLKTCEYWPGEVIFFCAPCWQVLWKEADARRITLRVLLRERYPEPPLQKGRC